LSGYGGGVAIRSVATDLAGSAAYGSSLASLTGFGKASSQARHSAWEDDGARSAKSNVLRCTARTSSSSTCSARTAPPAGPSRWCRSAGPAIGRIACGSPKWPTKRASSSCFRFGRWKGYGGDNDQGATLETVTWACGLLAKTKRLTIFGTVHAIPPLRLENIREPVELVDGKIPRRDPVALFERPASRRKTRPISTNMENGCAAPHRVWVTNPNWPL